MPGPEPTLVGFAGVLRAGGVAVTADRTRAFVEAVSRLGMGSRSATYWAGRCTLCGSADDLALYDSAFTAWFAAEEPPPSGVARPAAARRPQAALTAAGSGDGVALDDHALAVRASAAEVLRHRDVATLSPAERTELAALFAGLQVRPPWRRSFRRTPARRGGLDPRRTLREALRQAGEVTHLRLRRPSRRPRRVVWLVDVSGSMQPYADALLRLAHRVVQALPGQVEVFTLGTRLTHVTAALRQPHADRALADAGAVVPDWSGGTRLGEVLGAFLRRWGRRGLARDAVVVIASDGWERGDAALLGEQMRQLALLAHAVLWINPHRGKAGYAPVQSGIVASLPFVDDLVAGHSVAAFEELLGKVSRA